ncbi:MAG: type III-A CRISPR-associated RAMP protein Csm3 [Archaeoglobales archaeon]|nr:MAG: type III-A CRISPR-associated RAMP protein Csm3 [Archaeoglobales archaeon]
MGDVILSKVIVKGKIRLKTGLHIGAQRETMEIGGIDNPVIKDPVTGQPYIPGSSLKGKLRSLLEKVKGFKAERNIGTRTNPIYIHACDKSYDEIKNCEICRLFGTSGKDGDNFPARVLVRDAFLTEEFKDKWEEIVEIKYETAIDRITSAANPRPMERVPPGVEFEFEVVYNVEDEETREQDLKNLFSAMKLLEDDYLGGSGSRGYGKVGIIITGIVERPRDYYFGNKDERVLLPTDKIKPSEDGGVRVLEILEKFNEIFKHESS